MDPTSYHTKVDIISLFFFYERAIKIGFLKHGMGNKAKTKLIYDILMASIPNESF